MGILVARGGDGWLTRHQQFGRRCHTGEQMREDLGEESADRRAPSVNEADTVTGWQASSCMKMGWGRCRAGPTAEKMAHNDFSILNRFSN
jgi:hypothetical protein